MPIYSRIFENGTARLRCPSGVSRALFCRSETISKVGNIKIMSASSPFFFSPLSPPFSFLSRVVCRLMGVQKTQFRCRCGENGQIFRSHLFKNPGRYIYIYLLKTGLGILDFYHSDWLNGARLSAHIPAVTKYGQWTLNNKMNKVSWKFFPRQQPGEKNRQEKSLGSEFELSRNSNSVTNSVV